MTRLRVRQGVVRQQRALIAAMVLLPALAGGCAQDDGGQTYDDGNGLGKVGGKDQPKDNGSPPPTFDAAAPERDSTPTGDVAPNPDAGELGGVATVSSPNQAEVPSEDEPCYAPNSNLELATPQAQSGCSCSGARTACADGVAMVCTARGDGEPSVNHWLSLATGGCPADGRPCAGRMNDVMRCLAYFQSCIEEGDDFCGRDPLTFTCDDGLIVSTEADCEVGSECRKLDEEAYCSVYQLGGTPPARAMDAGSHSAESDSGATVDAGSAPSVAESDCARACNLVDECTSEATDDCRSRCMNSLIYDEEDGSRCLSQRIFWIDEEGCTSILDTYDGFDPEDTCH